MAKTSTGRNVQARVCSRDLIAAMFNEETVAAAAANDAQRTADLLEELCQPSGWWCGGMFTVHNSTTTAYEPA